MTDKRIAVVVGAAGGIGAAVVRLMRNRGLRVLGVDRNAGVSDLDGDPGYDHIRSDITEATTIADVASRICGAVECHIVNTSGGALAREVNAESESFLQMEVYEETFHDNFVTALACVRVALQVAPSNSSPGSMSIVLCSSINSIGNYRFPIYSASKAAIESLVYSMSIPLGGRGIRINCVRLGTVVTEASLSLHKKSGASHYEPLRQLTALKQFISHEDAARALVAAALELTGSSGTVLTVDGGQSVPGPR